MVVSALAPFAVATRFAQNGADANSAVKADVAALYLQDQLSFSPEWKILAGIRVDHFKLSFDDRRTVAAPIDLARTDNGVSPRIGVIWTPSASTSY